MKKSESIKYFDKLNKIIKGSKNVIDQIDSSSSINHEKAIKACMLNSVLLAECLKEILKDIVVDDYKGSNTDDEALRNLGNMFGFK
jgi:ribosomal protein S26